MNETSYSKDFHSFFRRLSTYPLCFNYITNYVICQDVFKKLLYRVGDSVCINILYQFLLYLHCINFCIFYFVSYIVLYRVSV